MDIRDLRYFMACAELGQLHRAAERVGRSQPAISKSLRRLEQEIGARLFDRVGRGVHLTPVGEALLAHARRLSVGLQAAMLDVAEVIRGDAGHVRIGSSPTMAEWLMPDLVQQLMATMPEVTLDVVIGLGDALRTRLNDGQLDLVVASLAPNDERHFGVLRLADDIMVVAARGNHPLSGGTRQAAELAPYGWMLPGEPLASTAWLRHAFMARELEAPRIQVQVSAKLVLNRVVANSDLLTFLSRRDLRPGNQVTLREIDCPDITMRRQFGVLSSLHGYMPAAAKRVWSLLEASGSGILGELPTFDPVGPRPSPRGS